MSQRRKNREVFAWRRLAALTLLLAIAPIASLAQDRSSGHDVREAAGARQLAAEAALTAPGQVLSFETSSVIFAALCFAVGFGACLMLVQCMLPALVHSQCVEIVREYLELARRESDVRIVVLDRDSHAPLQKPRYAGVPAAPTNTESSSQPQHHRRVDQPAAPASRADKHGDDAPNSMLSQIYEQNLHLRDQMRQQSQSVKQ